MTNGHIISPRLARDAGNRLVKAFRQILVFALCLPLVLPVPITVQAASAIKISSTPKGFETLTEPQTTLVDVYYAGRSLVSTLATFTADTISLANPLEVVSNIPKVKDTEAVVKSLTGELNSHTDLVCPEITQKVSAEVRKALLADCGRLMPKIAGVIFDESKFRLDIHVHPDYLNVYELGGSRYLPQSDADSSLVTSFSGAMSGSDDTKNDYSLRNQSVIGMGQGRIRLNSDYSSVDQWKLDTMTAELDREDHRFVTGAFRTRAMDTVGEFKMLGGRYTTTTDTRIDLDVGFGSQLVVFLPRDAQVDLVRDGRLLSTKFYQAGKTTLDTSQLPDGAYDVTLRIKEAGGVTREENRFYVKTATLPPADSPLYFLESGILLSEDSPPYPELNHVGLVHGGTFWRLTENIGVGGDFLAGENVVVGEARGLYLGRDLKLNLAGVLSTDLDMGLTFGATGELWDVTYSLSMRRNWAQNKSSTAATFDPVGKSFTQARGSLNYQWGDAQWSLQGATQSNDNADDTWSAGPAVTYPFLRTPEWGAILRAEATRSDAETVAMARVQIRFNEPRWSASMTSAVTNIRSNTASSTTKDGTNGDGSANLAWHDLDYLPGDLTLGVGATAEQRRRSLSSKADYISRWGKYSFDVENNWGGTTRSTRWGGNMATSVLTDGDLVAVGGRDRQDSGIVVALDGIASDAEFNVMVDGSNKGTVKIGDRMPVLLSPYKTYVVRLESTGGEFVSFNAENRDITLYPGNIIGVSWSIARIVAAFGRIVREDGTPVTFARVEGTGKGIFTDDLGYFQAELSKPGTFAVRPPEGEECEVVIETLPVDQDYADLKDLVCSTVLLEARTKPSTPKENVSVASADGKRGEDEFDWSPVISAYKRKVESSQGGNKPVAEEKPVVEEKPKAEETIIAAATVEPSATVSALEASGPTSDKAEADVVTAAPVTPAVPPQEPVVAARPVPEVEAPEEIVESGAVVAALASEVTETPAISEQSVQPAEKPRVRRQPKNLLARSAPADNTMETIPPAWRVQLAAFRQADKLVPAWKTISEKAAGRLDHLTAYSERADLGDKGIYFRLQTGDAPDRKTALSLCQDLRREGQSCRVVKVRQIAESAPAAAASFCTLVGESSHAPACQVGLVQVAEATPGLASGVSVDVADEKPAPEPKQQKIDLPRPDYRVQLGSHRTASAAIRDWQRIEKLSEGFLAGLIPEVAEVDMKRRGTWHRLQVPVPEGHIAARNLCDNLADLSVSCLVVRRRDS